MSLQTNDEPCAAVIFDGLQDFRFGPPNEDCCGFYQKFIENFAPGEAYVTNLGSWLTSVGLRDTRIFKLNDPDCKHYIFTFHDSTVEVIAQGFRVETDTCSVHSMISRQLKELGNG